MNTYRNIHKAIVRHSHNKTDIETIANIFQQTLYHTTMESDCATVPKNLLLIIAHPPLIFICHGYISHLKVKSLVNFCKVTSYKTEVMESTVLEGQKQEDLLPDSLDLFFPQTRRSHNT